MGHNIYVLTDTLLFININMLSLDLSRALAPVINLTDVPTLEVMLRAQTSTRVHIAIENIEPSAPQVIPVRIIEGMEYVATRGTATKKEYALISALVSLMRESPLIRA